MKVVSFVAALASPADVLRGSSRVTSKNVCGGGYSRPGERGALFNSGPSGCEGDFPLRDDEHLRHFASFSSAKKYLVKFYFVNYIFADVLEVYHLMKVMERDIVQKRRAYTTVILQHG